MIAELVAEAANRVCRVVVKHTRIVIVKVRLPAFLSVVHSPNADTQTIPIDITRCQVIISLNNRNGVAKVETLPTLSLIHI